jgi:hypothetical protein
VANSLTQRKWFPSHQPQTLQIACGLLYWNALISLISGLFAGGIGRLFLLLLVIEVAGAYGIANERKWGYGLAIGSAVLPLFLLFISGSLAGAVLSLIFYIALLALLLHPMSRGYVKVWFR